MQDYYEPKIGDRVTNFSLPSTEGRDLSLSEFKGKNIVLYFYPKDDTPGCTTEACGFRDSLDDLSKEGAVVLGVSTDGVDSHRKFREKHKLNFPLLSDETADVAKMFGAWKERNLYGRRSWGTARVTYLIDGNGRVRKVYRNVKPEEHAAEIVRDLRELKK